MRCHKFSSLYAKPDTLAGFTGVIVAVSLNTDSAQGPERTRST
ncbi:hypothetical protein V2A84_22525 [Yersinia sp. 2553 StPb PI]